MKWKRKKNNLKKQKLIFPLVGIFIIIAVVTVWKLNIFTINDFEVEAENVNCADENQIKTALSLKGQNFFLTDSAKIESNLKNKFFCIKSVNVSKRFPSKVYLEVFNRTAAAVLIDLKSNEASISSLIANVATPSAQDFKSAYEVDEESIVFAKDTNSASAPKIYTSNLNISFGKKLEGEALNNALIILNKIKTFGINADQSWISESNFLIYLAPPLPKVVFLLNDKTDYQLASLQLILTKAKIDSKELEFIDLRFDKPVVKFAPEKKK